MSKTNLKGETNRVTSADATFADPNATVVLADEYACESTRQSDGQPINAGEETIRARAHSKWEAAGCPAGDGIEFWLEAEREVNANRAGVSPAEG